MAVACRIVADISENSKAEIPAEVDEMLPSQIILMNYMGLP
jgi:hypothetical protein